MDFAIDCDELLEGTGVKGMDLVNLSLAKRTRRDFDTGITDGDVIDPSLRSLAGWMGAAIEG
jgi:hypothetical protein